MQHDLTLQPHECSSLSALDLANELNGMVKEIANLLQVQELHLETDGSCILSMGGDRYFSIWPDLESESLLLLADLAQPEVAQTEVIYRQALEFNWKAASVFSPVISLNEDEKLVLMGSMPRESDLAKLSDRVVYFLHCLELADRALGAGLNPETSLSALSPLEVPVPPSQDLLGELARAIGVERVEFDDKGFALFANGHQHLFVLQSRPDYGLVSIYAQIAALEGEGIEAKLQGALHYNFVAGRDHEPLLGLDSEAGGLFLITSLNLQDELQSDPEEPMELFLNRYAEFLNNVHDPSYPQSQEEPPSNDVEVIMGGIRI